MKTREMTIDDLRCAIGWINCRIGISFPSEAMPKTGLTVYDGEMIRLILIIYLERSSKMAVLGWCISNPENRPRQSLNAVRLALSEAEQYVREKDVRHLISIFGSRSLNRELERMGFFPGDSNIQQKYKFLR